MNADVQYDTPMIFHDILLSNIQDLSGGHGGTLFLRRRWGNHSDKWEWD